SALGVDCDPVAVECAKDYAAQNGFGDGLDFRCGKLEEIDPQGTLRPDLILANLDCRTLLLLCDELGRYGSHGARLLLSGILPDQEDEIIRAFSRVGVMTSRRREQEGWVALELLVVGPCEGIGA
ncbi:MAG TPA: 50S ribosomal protein L11 methyltransferase, partial [Nitrospiraceae bacterium]|nr:50S ribosomal protein L11 methyltransferase [Nitrospiraceae bacterium]